ncbi:hypothetical protein ACH5Y9_05500 [Methylomonas sp. BW4-1]|uniref:hypothetical protein n=1 Tax=Methylomonas sp. BW4-1 TaxID=3376685 RepID=UPI0040414B8D
MSWLAIILAFVIGWEAAHRTVATECKKLGKFYVGNEVFECRKISHSAGYQPAADSDTPTPPGNE